MRHCLTVSRSLFQIRNTEIFFLFVCFVVVVVVIVIVEAEQPLVISFFKTQPQFSCISLARDGFGSSYAALCHPPFSNSGW